MKKEPYAAVMATSLESGCKCYIMFKYAVTFYSVTVWKTSRVLSFFFVGIRQLLLLCLICIYVLSLCDPWDISWIAVQKCKQTIRGIAKVCNWPKAKSDTALESNVIV